MAKTKFSCKYRGMEIVVAGASGFIGSAFLDYANSKGWQIRQLVRRLPKPSTATVTQYQWDPDRRILDPQILVGTDAIICLSGAGIANHYWNKSYRKTLWDSRKQPLLTIKSALDQLSPTERPQQLLSGSAVGYYGDCGDTRLTEKNPAGNEFLARLCQQWENVANSLPVAKKTFLRTGLVIDQGGGILQPLKTLYSFYLGGKLGNGQQYMPTISRLDYIRALAFILQEQITGPVNLTGPQPLRNADFNEEMAKQLSVKAIFTVPRPMLTALLGEMSFLPLQSANVIPEKLIKAGFQFSYPQFADQLKIAFQKH